MPAFLAFFRKLLSQARVIIARMASTAPMMTPTMETATPSTSFIGSSSSWPSQAPPSPPRAADSGSPHHQLRRLTCTSRVNSLKYLSPRVRPLGSSGYGTESVRGSAPIHAPPAELPQRLGLGTMSAVPLTRFSAAFSDPYAVMSRMAS